ncbi:hypothetical protein F5887DRAFT_973233 [Amanita rubescens]|nr:hypothetical protein F5887DRAFT_973233 [Amanita rubescens]
MPGTFTIAEQAIIAKASQDLYRYERICTEHSAVLRRDLGALTKAQREYKANSKPMGLPRHSEKVLKKDCRTVLDHLHVVYAAYFVCRLLTIKSPAAIDVSSEPASSKEVMNLPRVPLQEMELIQYQRCPELLQRETFVSFNEVEAYYEVFRIPAFITADQEIFFYVVYADEGPEAMVCTSVDLFDLLRTSERVLN